MPFVTGLAAQPNHLAHRRILRLALQRLAALGLLCCIALSIQTFPVAQHFLAFGLSAYLLLLWRWPSAWLIAVPALLPVLDLTPWSGRTFFSEFDFLVLATVAASLLRKEPWFDALKFSRLTWLLVCVVIVWQGYTSLRGLLPLQTIDGNSFSSYYSSYNSLRMAKGFFLALLLLPALGQALYRMQDSNEQDSVGRLITVGMLCSLSLGLFALIWERALFTGLFNLDTAYRATGLFSGIATGGAAVDAHLLMTLPFTLLLFMLWRQHIIHLAGLALLALALYCTAITFSRANYPALALAMSTAVAADLWLARASLQSVQHFYQHLRSHKRFAGAGVLLLMIVIPLFSGNYIQQRFSSISEDLQTRLDHWQWSLRIMNDDLPTQLFGMGKGRFPNSYLWSRPDGQIPATAMHQNTLDDSFARFSPSDNNGNLYLRQRFVVSEPGPYHLKINIRPLKSQKTRLLIEVCERLIFEVYRECGWVGINTHKDSSRWESYNKQINVEGLGKEYWYGSRPIDLAILNRGLKDGIDIDSIQLITPSGRELLSNGNFDDGLDHWLVHSGDHLAWHIKNIWVDTLFEGGYLGLLIFLALTIALGYVLLQRLGTGDWFVIPLVAAFSGALTVGLFDTLFDEPRISLMFYLLFFITLAKDTGIFHIETHLTDSWLFSEGDH